MQRTFALVLPVYVPTLLLSAAAGLLIPTLPLYAKSFGVSLGLVSMVIAALGIGTLIGDVPTGMMLERFGRKPVMIGGTILLAISGLALGYLHYFVALLLLRLLAGFGTAMWNISRMAYLGDTVPVRDRGRALSMFGGVNRIGAFIGPAVGGFIAQQYGLAAPFYVSFAAAALATLISIFFIRETHHQPAGQRRHTSFRTVGRVVRHHYHDLFVAGSAQVFAQMIRAGRQIIIPLYAYQIGLDVAQIGTILSIANAVDMSLFIPAGFLMDRLGRKFASVPSFIVLAIGMSLIPLSSGYTGLLVASCVMGLGNGIGSGTMMTLGTDLAPRESTGEFLGVWRLVGDIGSSGGPLVVGAIADAIGLVYSAFVLSGFGVLAAGTLFLFVRETLDRSHRRSSARLPASSPTPSTS